MSASNYNWLRDAALPGLSALLETLWIYAWVSFALASIGSTAQLRFPFPFLFALIAAPPLLRRGLRALSRPRPVWRAMAGLLVCALVLLAFLKAELAPTLPIWGGQWLGVLFVPWWSPRATSELGLIAFAWLVAGVLLLRGLWQSAEELDPDRTQVRFLAGLGAFLALFVSLDGSGSSMRAFDPERQLLGLWLSVYFVVGVAWMGLARQQGLERQAFRTTLGRVDLAWVLMLGVLSGLLLAVGALAFALGGGAARVLESVALTVFAWLWTLVQYAAFVLRELLVFLSNLVPRGGGSASAPLAPAPPPPLAPPPVWHLPHWQLGNPSSLLEVAAVILVGILVMVAAVMARSAHGQWGGEVAEEEQRSSLWSWGLFWRGLRDQFKRSRGPRRPAPDSAQTGLAAAERIPAVRELYRAVLRFGRTHGLARNPGQTPSEYRPILARAVPPDLTDAITAAYIETRYGERALVSAKADRLIQRWESFEAGQDQESGAPIP
ncbi:MAG TPA: DUF4129 domain-containing protein [Candidatus Acidoferrales bacterium]|nr:DUF4129 domain-containing protein [Candidatus Acidoferrales bacterium]